MAAEKDHQAWPELVKGLWKENPIFIQMLGLCPTMAVTNGLRNSLVMAVATAFVLVCSSLFVSLLRKLIPGPIRITAYIVIIATFVTTVDFTLAALVPDAHREIGAFIALIVVNCIILGRAEAFAAKAKPVAAVMDALGMSLGFTLALVLIGSVRELLGSGSLFGVRVLPESFEPWAIMVLPPGGFFTMGALLMTFAWRKQRSEARKALALAGETDTPRAA